MEASGKRIDVGVKRGAGRKTASNAVHGAQDKNPDLRLLQQSVKKLTKEDGSTLHGNPVRTIHPQDCEGIVIPKPTSSLQTGAGERCPATVGTELMEVSAPLTVDRQGSALEALSKRSSELHMGNSVAEGLRKKDSNVGKSTQRGESRGRSIGPDVRKTGENGRAGGWLAKGVRNAVQPGRTFASLLNANPMGKKMKLDYVQPEMEGEQPVFVPKEEVMVQAKKKWEDFLVGYFISGSLALTGVERAARAYWEKLGLGKILVDASGFYFFEIPDASVRMKILEEGPWMFYGRGMVLQQWTPELTLCKQNHSRIPLWVRFHKVPLTLWTEAGLSGVASLVGKPLYADSYTESMKKIDFARICVEVEATKPLPETVTVHMAGEVIHIPVDYQWKPVRCSKCGVFGHMCKTEEEGSHQMGKTTDERVQITPAQCDVEKEEFIPVRNGRKGKRVGSSEGSHSNPEQLNRTMIKNGAPGGLQDVRMKQLPQEGGFQTTASSRTSSSSTSPYSSEGSDTEEESSEEATSNAVELDGKQMSKASEDQGKGEIMGNQTQVEKRDVSVVNGDAALSQIVAAIPNDQFQQKLTNNTLPKKPKKSAGKSRASKPRRR